LSSAKNEINSTEKLLNVIRGKDEEQFSSFDKKGVSSSGRLPDKKTKFSFPESLFDKKVFTVGVDISGDFICFAKTAKDSGSRRILVDQRIIKCSPNISVGSPEFNSLLKSSLLSFCGSTANCSFWAKISAGQVNIYFIKIPRVPKKQLENVIYWTIKKEGFLDETTSIFDYELQDATVEPDKSKQSVMVYTAPKAEIEKIKTMFSGIGIELSGITTVPFAMQNIFRSKWMPATEEIFASLFIGENYSRIDVYDKENLVMTRGIKTGSSSSMAEAIVSSVLEKTGGLRLEKEEARKILFSMGPESDKTRKEDSRKDFKKEEILEMISPVWERLARQVDLTLKTSSIGNRKVEKIYIISSVNIDKSILDYMSDQLGTKTDFFDPLKQRQISAAEKTLSLSDKILLSPALGFALSDNKYTPNLIYTYLDKNKDATSKRINRIALFSFLAALIICIAAIVYQGATYNNLKKEKINLEKELALFSPLLSTETVLKEANELKTQRTIARQYVQKYTPLAVIGEISDMTPQNVRLINCRIVKGLSAPVTDAQGKTTQEVTNDVTIEGIVSGDKSALDSLLGQYVVRLENSPLFNSITVQKNSIIKFKKDEVLHFMLNAKIG
jgi:hypothetical protein